MSKYSDYVQPTIFRGNIGLPQFVASCSKTKNAMNFIKDQQLVDQDLTDFELWYNVNHGQINNHHRISFIFTNNSLEESKMWKVRANNDLGHLNICTLSSSTDAKYNNFKDFHDFLLDIRKKEELPHVVIMCSNITRVNNIIKLIERFEVQINFHPDINVLPFFDVIFDEADKNITVINTFLKSSIVRKTEKPGSLLSVMFVTATPFECFWNMLETNNIDSLDRTWLNERLEKAAVQFETFTDYYRHLLNTYRKLTDHKHIACDYDTKNPKEYVEHVFDQLIGSSLTVYAPAKMEIASHLEMAEFFLSKKYTVLLHNGTFKEFRFPDKTTITVADFCQKFKVQGEMRDVLVAFRKHYPMANLAITGNKTIERGITFNTTDFNFTHAIISSYHANDSSTLFQMLGRLNGDVAYIGIITIISPQKIMSEANRCFQCINKILETKPEILCCDDFNDHRTKVCDPYYPCKKVPIVCEITAEEYKDLVDKGLNRKKYNHSKIISFLQNKYEWINTNEYNESTLLQVSKIDTNGLSGKASKKTRETSYEKHILAGLKKCKSNEGFTIDMKFKTEELKRKKCWNIFIDGYDKINPRLVIYRWDGSLL
jgi:hypothetical protein